MRLHRTATALVTLALVTFLFSWNAFLWPLVVLSSPHNAVVQIAIAQSAAPGQLDVIMDESGGVQPALAVLFAVARRTVQPGGE